MREISYKKYVLNIRTYLVPEKIVTIDLDMAVSKIRNTTSGEGISLTMKEKIALDNMLQHTEVITL